MVSAQLIENRWIRNLQTSHRQFISGFPDASFSSDSVISNNTTVVLPQKDFCCNPHASVDRYSPTGPEFEPSKQVKVQSAQDQTGLMFLSALFMELKAEQTSVYPLSRTAIGLVLRCK